MTKKISTILGCIAGIIFISAALTGCKSIINSSKNKTQSTNDKLVKKTDISDTQKTPDENMYNTILSNLGEINEYMAINNHSGLEFADWLYKKYGYSFIEKLSQSDDLKNYIYTNTGVTIYLLMDEFLGINECSKQINKSVGNANLVFAGDICLTDSPTFVMNRFKQTNNIYDCIGNNIIDLTNNADLFMLNNEFSVSERGEPLKGKFYTFRANPSNLSILDQLGTDIVSLANNHVYDYGVDAFSDTLLNLSSHNIPYVGAGANIEEAEKPIYINVNGIKIGFISACNAEKNRFTPGATENSPGIFLMYDHTDLINKCVDASKRCDYLIAFLHWGNEDSKYYTNDQHNLASELINDGADAIIGAHPHVLQGMEYINGCPVVYSLGDFWFNSETKYNGLISLDINSNGYVNMSIVPTIQSEFTTSKISNQEELNKYRDYINSLSSGCSVDENFNFITRN